MGNSSGCGCNAPQEIGNGGEIETVVPSPLDTEDVRLTVAIAGASGLRDMAWMVKSGSKGLKVRSGCRCTVEVSARRRSVRFRTSVAHDALAPVPIWKTLIQIAEYVDGTPLVFCVTDEGGTGAVLGRARLAASEFAEKGFNAELPLTGGKYQDAFLKVKVRNSGQDFPPGPPPTFSVAIEKEANQSVGLDLDVQDGMNAYVLAVNDGPFRSYNENAAPDYRLQHGDFIMEVNGTPGNSPDLLNIMKMESKLSLVVQRPEEFSVLLVRQRRDEPLGLTFHERPCGRTLPVVGMAGGMVEEWNAAHGNFEVRADDRIVKVNGQPGEAAELLASTRDSEKVLLTIMRPATTGESGSWRFW